ncbi:hypothetical protein [Lacrimispora sp.]|uniref:hypothetical protein n=1 Tax=Lacrimispora sp. TaxID=2719234 RepID=UPI002896E940|nr:hypothetical protein [Lacrimispora sp.]
MKDTVTTVGTLDPWKAFEALGRIIGDKYGVEVKLLSLRDKNETAKDESGKTKGK